MQFVTPTTPLQSANSLLSSFAVRGGDDLARKCYMTAHDRNTYGVETNFPAKKTAYAVFQCIIPPGALLPPAPLDHSSA